MKDLFVIVLLILYPIAMYAFGYNRATHYCNLAVLHAKMEFLIHVQDIANTNEAWRLERNGKEYYYFVKTVPVPTY